MGILWGINSKQSEQGELKFRLCEVQQVGVKEYRNPFVADEHRRKLIPDQGQTSDHEGSGTVN